MKFKDDGIFDKIGKVVSLQLMLEKDINTLQPFSGDDLLNIDTAIHKIRKSLKSISAILYLYEFQFDQSQFLDLKFSIKSLSKQFAGAREHFINLQIFYTLEDKLKDIDKNDIAELRAQFELNYNLILQENMDRKEAIQKGNEAIQKINEVLLHVPINSELKLLKRRLLNSYQKSQKLYKRLTLNSSSDQFHEFRKWCKRFYLQQAAFNRLGLSKTYKQNKKLYKLTEYLGKEHDLQLFIEYLNVHFTELSQSSHSFFKRKTKNLRKKIFMLYPEIEY